MGTEAMSRVCTASTVLFRREQATVYGSVRCGPEAKVSVFQAETAQSGVDHLVGTKLWSFRNFIAGLSGIYKHISGAFLFLRCASLTVPPSVTIPASVSATVHYGTTVRYSATVHYSAAVRYSATVRYGATVHYSAAVRYGATVSYSATVR